MAKLYDVLIDNWGSYPAYHRGDRITVPRDDEFIYDIPYAIANGWIAYVSGSDDPASGGGGGGGGGHVIADESTPLAARTTLAFLGSGVVAADDAAGDRTTVTIAGGGGGNPAYLRTPVLPPTLSNWAWVNQGGAVATDETGGLDLELPLDPGAGNNVRGLFRTAPATPYTVVMGFIPRMVHTNYNRIGFHWRDSVSGKLVGFTYGMTPTSPWPSLESIFYNSPTSYNSGGFAIGAMSAGALQWFKAQDDGTNRKCWWSPDGNHWLLLNSVARTTFTTPNQIGIAGEAVSGNNAPGMTLVSWEES